MEVRKYVWRLESMCGGEEGCVEVWKGVWRRGRVWR